MANTLAAKIAKASADVGGRLKADKTNTQDRYNYISADKILAECGQALAAVGVSVIPAMTDADINIGETAGGKRRFDARVTFVMTVTDGETESAQPWFGFGADYTTPDKAVYKAVTSGHKYFLSKLLMIGEGNEDGEHEAAPEAPQQAPARQANGNGKPLPVQVATGNGAPQNDNPFNDDAPAGGLSDKQQKMIHAVGMTIYGDGWNDKRSALVSAITDGRTEHASDMTKQEASGLINFLKLHELGIKAFGSIEAFEGKTAQAVAKFGPLWKWQRKDIDLWTQKLEAAAAQTA